MGVAPSARVNAAFLPLPQRGYKGNQRNEVELRDPVCIAADTDADKLVCRADVGEGACSALFADLMDNILILQGSKKFHVRSFFKSGLRSPPSSEFV